MFAGPSFLRQDLDHIDTGLFDVRPPIRRGDLPQSIADGYTTIGIIDGEFYQRLAVSPKELLAALNAGVSIVGGASMGALRAVELHPYGMVGVGEIYRWYRSGAVTRDDDVGVVYAIDDDGNYRLLSAPMVNVMWVTRTAAAAGWLDASTRRRITLAARRIPWTERTWRGICLTAGLGKDLTKHVLDYAANPANDRKRLDGLAVIESLSSLLAGTTADRS